MARKTVEYKQARIILGCTATDRITGFTGVVTGFCSYISGCSQALLAPKAVDNKMQDANWFDVQRLDRVDRVAVIQLDNGDTPGFDRQAPVR